MKKMDEQPDPDAKPIDWYCKKCSEVVLIGERCRICGKTEREKA